MSSFIRIIQRSGSLHHPSSLPNHQFLASMGSETRFSRRGRDQGSPLVFSYRGDGMYEPIGGRCSVSLSIIPTAWKRAHALCKQCQDGCHGFPFVARCSSSSARFRPADRACLCGLSSLFGLVILCSAWHREFVCFSTRWYED